MKSISTSPPGRCQRLPSRDRRFISPTQTWAHGGQLARSRDRRDFLAPADFAAGDGEFHIGSCSSSTRSEKPFIAPIASAGASAWPPRSLVQTTYAFA